MDWQTTDRAAPRRISAGMESPAGPETKPQASTSPTRTSAEAVCARCRTHMVVPCLGSHWLVVDRCLPWAGLQQQVAVIENPMTTTTTTTATTTTATTSTTTTTTTTKTTTTTMAVKAGQKANIKFGTFTYVYNYATPRRHFG